MTTDIYNETLAELHAMLDTLPVEDESDLQSQIDAIDRVAAPTVKQPEIVAASITCAPAPAQKNKEDAASDALFPQCADPTLTPHPHQRTNTKTESVITSPEGASKHPLRQETTRKPRLKTARLDEIARTKSWDGTRGLNRKDKLIVLMSGERDKRSADRVLVRASCRRPTQNIGPMKPLQSSTTKHRLCA